MRDRHVGEIFINPCYRRPSAVRSMLPRILFSRKVEKAGEPKPVYPCRPRKDA